MEAPRTSRTTGMRSEFDGLFARCRIWRSVDPLARRSELAASLAKARRKAAFLATIGPQEDCWQQLPFGVRARCGWRSWGDFLRPSGDRVQRYTSIFRTTFSSPGKSTLSSCRPSLLHDRWRDWCPAGVLSWEQGRRQMTKAPCRPSWCLAQRRCCQRRHRLRTCAIPCRHHEQTRSRSKDQRKRRCKEWNGFSC